MLQTKEARETTDRILTDDPRYEARGYFARFRDGVFRRVWRAYYKGIAIGEIQGYTSLRMLEDDLRAYIEERDCAPRREATP